MTDNPEALNLEPVEFTVYCVLREKMFTDIHIASRLSEQIAETLHAEFEIHKRPEAITR